jgi:conjugal transfer/entry exclusion protein
MSKAAGNLMWRATSARPSREEAASNAEDAARNAEDAVSEKVAEADRKLRDAERSNAEARAAMQAAQLEATHVAEDTDQLDTRRTAILNELAARENAIARREADAGERETDAKSAVVGTGSYRSPPHRHAYWTLAH